MSFKSLVFLFVTTLLTAQGARVRHNQKRRIAPDMKSKDLKASEDDASNIRAVKEEDKSDSALLQSWEFDTNDVDLDLVSFVEEDAKEVTMMNETTMQKCTEKFDRFDQIADQDLSRSVGRDPYFPPSGSSIAARGTNCGDSAQGISESCEKYNTWKTFQDVSERKRQPFKVFGSSGITFNDIGQGTLGNCYFLAAIASIAHANPTVIRDMFVDTHLWSKNVFKTKWLLNGKESIVSVDNMIPADRWSRPHFTQATSTGEFWTVILAKTWAKIFGSFKAIEGGFPHAAVEAITRAPGEVFKFKDTPQDKVWENVLEGTNQKYPMTVSTGGDANPTKFGLAQGHAYSLLKAYRHSKYGKVVQVYNPWGKEYYTKKGVNAIPDIDRIPGAFTMRFSEFLEAFSYVGINYMHSGGQVTERTIPAGSIEGAVVSVSTPGKFFVSVVWPNERMVRPCKFLDPDGFIQASASDAPGTAVGRVLKPFYKDNHVTVEVEGKAGKSYTVLASETFRKDATWIKNVKLVVYSEGPATITSSNMDGKTMSLSMFGPNQQGKACDVITVPGLGTFTADMSKLMSGIPTYWSSNKKHVFFSLTGFSNYNLPITGSASEHWAATSGNSFSSVASGKLTYYSNFMKHKTEFQCSSTLSGTGGSSSNKPSRPSRPSRPASRGPVTAGKSCACRQTWKMKGHGGYTCNSGCCNPDSDPRGAWCFVEDKSCQGSNWGYCA